ncbi:hypothetical protein Y032_0864g2755 [Ancylostoma ceylanicum]|uniref:BPTI/Kunitz inhibitor domain-containing protein n=1 Tax=Ancylostoma ceylanicum TaxID=53326 RepID=A0A016WAP5_9BILA|nr:hypothetical protein Y032_0864g2755 [Ancylostoma ceylanicum]
MRLSLIVPCVLVYFCTPTLAKEGSERSQKCYAPSVTIFIACLPDTSIYTYNKETDRCIQCCGCFGINKFFSKEECEETCRQRR